VLAHVIDQKAKKVQLFLVFLVYLPKFAGLKSLKILNMKKMFVMLAVASSMVLASCGGDDAKEGGAPASACDCKKKAQEIMDKARGAKPEDREAIEKEMKTLEEQCKDFKPEDAKDCK
jgi:hypothetical protein